MSKYAHGELRSGGPNGKKVTNHKQAVAIMLSEKRKEDEHGGHYPEGHHRKPHKRPQTRLKDL